MNGKSKAGLTLLEVTIALALWLILSAGVFFAWQYSVRASAAILAGQNAFENARATMDVLIMNIQMSSRIEIYNDENGIMQRLVLYQDDTLFRDEPYEFRFDINAGLLVFARQRTIAVGAHNAFADGIGEIRITYVPGRRIEIFVITACEAPREPIRLWGSTDVRYKEVEEDNPG